MAQAATRFAKQRNVLMFATPEERAAWRARIHRPLSESEFDAAARELYAWQVAHCEPLKRLATARGRLPDQLDCWRDIPAVPQRLFKEVDLYCPGPEAPPAAIYHTSGTTTRKPGRQHLRQVDLYNATVIEGARHAGLLAAEHELHFLAPPPREAPHSSLSAMFQFWSERWGARGSAFWVRKERLLLHGLREHLEAGPELDGPVGLCGTAFAFAHYIDAYSPQDPVELPEGSWILETGGFKGRSREIPKDEFYQALAYLFRLPVDRIWNEYGMTELSSQAYAQGPTGAHRAPPWARVRVVDPETGRQVPEGEVGLVEWVDLANVDSVLAVGTLDLAVPQGEGFQLLGRAAGSTPRGCSLTAEEFRPGENDAI